MCMVTHRDWSSDVCSSDLKPSRLSTVAPMNLTDEDLKTILTNARDEKEYQNLMKSLKEQELEKIVVAVNNAIVAVWELLTAHKPQIDNFVGMQDSMITYTGATVSFNKLHVLESQLEEWANVYFFNNMDIGAGQRHLLTLCGDAKDLTFKVQFATIYKDLPLEDEAQRLIDMWKLACRIYALYSNVKLEPSFDLVK
jgi:hypothetical protein